MTTLYQSGSFFEIVAWRGAFVLPNYGLHVAAKARVAGRGGTPFSVRVDFGCRREQVLRAYVRRRVLGTKMLRRSFVPKTLRAAKKKGQV